MFIKMRLYAALLNAKRYKKQVGESDVASAKTLI